jgi:DNA invertase Pin-like site-specific DNA recombinase
MAQGKFVAYYRVSTEKQGRSGLGLETQQEAVRAHLNGGHWRLAAEVVEIDRLARNVAFISNLMESGVEFTAVDFPQANRLTVHILAAVAEHEREMISQRTKAALAAAKARGTKLGGDRGNLRAVGDRGREISRTVRIKKASDRVADLSPIIAEIRASGATSLGRIAKALNERGIRTPRGAEWQPVQVKRVLERIAT